MTNSLEAVKLFTKAIIDAKPWKKDPLAVRKDWSEKEERLEEHGGGKALCFAIMWDNGVVKPHPPLRRAMEITKKALEAAGHKGANIDLPWCDLPLLLRSCSLKRHHFGRSP